MPMFFSRKNTRSLALIVDVQSSIVRSTLVLYDNGAVPTVIGTHQTDIAYRPHLHSPSHLIKSTDRAITETVGASLMHLSALPKDDQAPRSVSTVHFVLSSPWIASQAKSVSVSFPKNEIVTRPKVMAIIEEQRAGLHGASDPGMRVIEEKIFDVRLNGYSVSDWEGKEARDLQVSFAASMGSSSIIERFADAAAHAARKRDMRFHSSLLLQHIAIRDVLPHKKSYVLVHVHGEITDIVAVRDHSCTFFGTFPIGLDSIARKAARSLHTDAATADSVIRSVAAGALDGQHGKDTEARVRHIFEGWVHDLSKLITTAGSDVPARIPILVSAQQHEDILTETLEAHMAGSQIERVSIDDLAGHMAFDKDAPRLLMPGLYAIAIHNASAAKA